MKKTLAIVLALVMVLCMIPAMSAETYTVKTVADKNYTLVVKSVGTQVGDIATAEKANSITYSYNFEKEDADATGKWSADTKMAYVTIKGLDDELVNDVTVTIDGKKLDSSIPGVGFSAGEVSFPIELTKAGYTDTYLVQLTGKNAGGTVVVTETAKVSVKLVNTAAYKDAKTATIIDVDSDKDIVDAYIVGSKIYLDYVADTTSGTTIDLTFADENGKKFSAITYASEPTKTAAICLNGYTAAVAADKQQKLDASTATYYVNGAEDKGIVFGLETSGALYETKKYDIVVRTGIVEENPKGIYFAENTKTIAVGESFTPVVLGVATNKRVDAKIYVGYGDYINGIFETAGNTVATDKQVLDVEDEKTVIGVREGVAFISAMYIPRGGDKYTAIYASSAMKIVVTAGPSIPPVVKTEVYYVTCRNLNVRKGAGTSYAKVGMIHRGDAVEVVEIKGGWAKLADGTYVCAKYIA
ncbi:MAG: SH3 domain-containing protein, partial [Candidatus Spyradocola sp.]